MDSPANSYTPNTEEVNSPHSSGDAEENSTPSVDDFVSSSYLKVHKTFRAHWKLCTQPY